MMIMMMMMLYKKKKRVDRLTYSKSPLGCTDDDPEDTDILQCCAEDPKVELNKQTLVKSVGAAQTRSRATAPCSLDDAPSESVSQTQQCSRLDVHSLTRSFVRSFVCSLQVHLTGCGVLARSAQSVDGVRSRER
jgi:hypothetical protein